MIICCIMLLLYNRHGHTCTPSTTCSYLFPGMPCGLLSLSLGKFGPDSGPPQWCCILHGFSLWWEDVCLSNRSEHKGLWSGFTKPRSTARTPSLPLSALSLSLLCLSGHFITPPSACRLLRILLSPASALHQSSPSWVPCHFLKTHWEMVMLCFQVIDPHVHRIIW